MLASPATQYVIDEEGRKTAVLLSLSAYEQLLEDLHDLAVIAQRREETPVDLETMLERLGINFIGSSVVFMDAD